MKISTNIIRSNKIFVLFQMFIMQSYYDTIIKVMLFEGLSCVWNKKISFLNRECTILTFSDNFNFWIPLFSKIGPDFSRLILKSNKKVFYPNQIYTKNLYSVGSVGCATLCYKSEVILVCIQTVGIYSCLHPRPAMKTAQ